MTNRAIRVLVSFAAALGLAALATVLAVVEARAGADNCFGQCVSECVSDFEDDTNGSDCVEFCREECGVVLGPGPGPGPLCDDRPIIVHPAPVACYPDEVTVAPTPVTVAVNVRVKKCRKIKTLRYRDTGTSTSGGGKIVKEIGRARGCTLEFRLDRVPADTCQTVPVPVPPTGVTE